MSDGRTHTPLLEIEDVRVTFGRPPHQVRAVDGVSGSLAAGESIGLVGESGCGKTTLGRAVMGLTPLQTGRIAFGGRDIAGLTGRDAWRYRKQVQMIFQDPYGSLNARMTVGKAIEEVLQVHGWRERAARQQRLAALFESVGLDPEYRDRYPHEFSGGQRQRLGIARALAVEPQLLIADEPVSALDVSVQVQILNLMKDLQRELNLAFLFVAHDLAVVRYVCDRIWVMYLGRIIESGTPDEIFNRPRHPYTQALLSAVPDVEKGLRERVTGSSRTVLKGDVPSPIETIAGCPFHPRCPIAEATCRSEVPEFRSIGAGHKVACHLAKDTEPGHMESDTPQESS
jgi:oligopeptide/dipeptide ABC transporter ATP-binding protein